MNNRRIVRTLPVAKADRFAGNRIVNSLSIIGNVFAGKPVAGEMLLSAEAYSGETYVVRQSTDRSGRPMECGIVVVTFSTGETETSHFQTFSEFQSIVFGG